MPSAASGGAVDVVSDREHVPSSVSAKEIIHYIEEAYKEVQSNKESKSVVAYIFRLQKTLTASCSA